MAPKFCYAVRETKKTKTKKNKTKRTKKTKTKRTKKTKKKNISVLLQNIIRNMHNWKSSEILFFLVLFFLALFFCVCWFCCFFHLFGFGFGGFGVLALIVVCPFSVLHNVLKA